MSQQRRLLVLLCASGAFGLATACGTDSTTTPDGDTSSAPDTDAGGDTATDTATDPDAAGDAGDAVTEPDTIGAPDSDAITDGDTEPDVEQDGSGEEPECTEDAECEEGFRCDDTLQACVEILPTCSDLQQNGDEEGIDCGGSTCDPCPTPCDEGISDCFPAQRCELDETEVSGRRCVPIQVLILEEGSGSASVGDMLETLGADIVRGPLFAEWDAVDPGLDDIDSVIWMEGRNYSSDMGAEAQTALADFVADGGGLVRTEWSTYSANEGSADVLLPVDAPDSDYEYGNTWTRVVADHPIGASLDAEFDIEGAGFSVVQADEGSIIVWSGAEDNPLLTVTESFGGRVVHINHDVVYSVDELGPIMDRMFADAAIWAAGLGASPGEPEEAGSEGSGSEGSGSDGSGSEGSGT